LDTEKAFSSLRLSEIATSFYSATTMTAAQQQNPRDLIEMEGREGNQYQNSSMSPLDLNVMQMIRNVTVFDITTTSQLMEKLQTLGMDELVYFLCFVLGFNVLIFFRLLCQFFKVV
jgi:hypothetical protein